MLRVPDRPTGANLLTFIPPLRPTLATEPPEGDGWLHEIKHDGYRTELVVIDDRAQAFTMNGYDWSNRYRFICQEAGRLPCRSAIIDGEAIMPDQSGVADFEALRLTLTKRPHRSPDHDPGILYFAFDLLHLDGRDLRSWPIEERRAALKELLRGTNSRSSIHLSETVTGQGGKVFAAAERIGLEGIVSKRLGSRYRSGRSPDWRKAKCTTEGEFVVIDAAPNPKGPPYALLARERGGELVYAGSAFVTLDEKSRDTFWKQTETLATQKPPIAGLRRQKVTWCKASMRVRARHLRGEGPLRHAALVALCR